jgi:hypothetical protein
MLDNSVLGSDNIINEIITLESENQKITIYELNKMNCGNIKPIVKD